MRAPILLSLLLASTAWPQANRGYYRFPAIHGESVVFTAEGDLWQVNIAGGAARRLTSHPGEETHAAFSPDGKTIAFTANYEGPDEVYTMPASGGLPVRRTFDGTTATVAGWTPDGKVLYTTRRYATLPDAQLVTIDERKNVALIPLSQAADGSFDAQGRLFFTRQAFQGSHAKRYKGGTAQNIWRYTAGREAVPLTGDYAGASKNPMVWNGRVYFLSDRDGTMNLWSMDENGRNLKQHTRHQGWDIHSAALSQGRVVYQMGADLRLYEIAAARDRVIPIELSSDFDHLREHWIRNPQESISSVHVAPDGSRVTLAARGRIFVAPVKNGRLVDIAEHKPGRFRDAIFMPDGKNLLVLSSESGEVELWKMPADGIGAGEQITRDGHVLRWEGVPSPDGKWIAHQDKDAELWLLDTATKTHKRIARSPGTSNTGPRFDHLRWSPDSRWLVFSEEAPNQLSRIMLYSVETGAMTPLTSDRYANGSPAWSSDGKWIYFVSDRALHTQVFAPWGTRLPEPYFDRAEKIYMLALRKGLRSPFRPPDELHPDRKKEEEAKGPVKVEIDLDGIAGRLEEVPVPSGNYRALDVAGNRLCWVDITRGRARRTASLACLEIDNKGAKPDDLLDDIRDFQVSADGKKIMVWRQNEILVIDARIKPAAFKEPKTFEDSRVDLRSWAFSVIPSDEFREGFLDAWRLHRDYFYDPHMHGVNWKAMRDKYGELVGRLRDRAELNDLIADMVGELSALHASVTGGDIRRGPEQIQIGALGAQLDRDAEAGGYRVKHIYRSDPDRPDRSSPLARPGVGVGDGDVLLAINGRDLLGVSAPGELLRNEAGKQVRLRVKPKDADPRDVMVRPMSLDQEADLRYHEWEYTRRLEVERAGRGAIGYVHLRAMGPNDIDQWMEEYVPIFHRDGLIVDARHNRGGNIDSWILERLMRKAWMYWQPRVGTPNWNMQGAFRGHMVVLCDERTASDGEAFSEGFRRLGLGKVIGTRTWGGEIWLSGSNRLADRGVATAAENGVFGPEGKWLIEGHGVDPDVVVDNLPHATFEGADAQLAAAIAHLQRLIKEKPVGPPAAPKYPDKSWKQGQ
jgi:tricorn protease